MPRMIFNESYGKEGGESSWFHRLFMPKPGGLGSATIRIYVLLLIGTVVSGIWLSYSEHAHKTEELNHNLSQWVQINTTTLQASTLQQLKGNLSDEQLPEYQNLEKHLQAIRSLRHDEIRFVYLLGIRGDTTFFYVDSEPEHSPDKSRPGDPYPELPNIAQALFRQGSSAVVEPYTDRWGKWISAFVRLPELSGSGTPILLGMDFDYADADAQILHATLRPLYQMAFVLVCLLVVGLTLVKLRKQALLLASSERAFHDLAVNLSDRLWQTDEDMIFTYCSDRVKDILGYDVNEVIGKSMVDFVAPEDRERVTSFLTEVFAGRQPFRQLEYWGLSKEGVRVCLETSGTPVLYPSGRFCGFRGVDSNVTEKRKIEDSLTRRDLLLEAAAKSGDELVSGEDHVVASRNVLRTLGMTIDADRAYICTISCGTDEETHFLKLLCACDCAFILGEMHESNPPALPGNVLVPRWYDTLSTGLPIASHVKDLPEAEQYMLSVREVKSILILPIMMHGSLWGVAFFEACTMAREWTLGEIMILLTSSSSIGTTLLRKHAELKSKESEAWLQALLDTANDFAIVATTPEGVISLYNVGAQRLLGYLPDEVVDKFPLLTFHVMPEVDDLGMKFARTGELPLEGFAVFVEGVHRHGVWKQEWTYVTKGGHRIRARASIGEIRDVSGELHGFISVIMPLNLPQEK